MAFDNNLFRSDEAVSLCILNIQDVTVIVAKQYSEALDLAHSAAASGTDYKVHSDRLPEVRSSFDGQFHFVKRYGLG